MATTEWESDPVEFTKTPRGSNLTGQLSEVKVVRRGKSGGIRIFVTMGFTTKSQKERWLHAYFCGCDKARGNGMIADSLGRVGT